MTDKIDKLIDDLPEFMRPIVASYAGLVRRLTEQEFWALIDLAEFTESETAIEEAAQMLTEYASINDLATMKQQLTAMTERMASDRELTRSVARELMRASLRAAIQAALS